jgi:UDPglucose 6-dehydrogenase
LIIIAVNTPKKANGEANNEFVMKAARDAARGFKPHQTYTMVLKSTVLVGTSRRMTQEFQRVHIVSNPEFLRQGTALYDILYPDRIVVGSEREEAVQTIRRLYQPILEQTFAPPAFLPRPDGYSLPPLMITEPVSAEGTAC